ncbi:MAG: hypothetical protein MJ252_27795, partial [archaeon]|nr:hypothetical protein [archaeon]
MLKKRNLGNTEGVKNNPIQTKQIQSVQQNQVIQTVQPNQIKKKDALSKTNEIFNGMKNNKSESQYDNNKYDNSKYDNTKFDPSKYENKYDPSKYDTTKFDSKEIPQIKTEIKSIPSKETDSSKDFKKDYSFNLNPKKDEPEVTKFRVRKMIDKNSTQNNLSALSSIPVLDKKEENTLNSLPKSPEDTLSLTPNERFEPCQDLSSIRKNVKTINDISSIPSERPNKEEYPQMEKNLKQSTEEEPKQENFEQQFMSNSQINTKINKIPGYEMDLIQQQTHTLPKEESMYNKFSDYDNKYLFNNQNYEAPINENIPTFAGGKLRDSKEENNMKISENINIDNQLKNNSSITDENIRKKQKINKVADLVTKINSDEELFEIISKIFGEDILDVLTSPKVEDNLVESVEQSVLKVEELRKKDEEEDAQKMSTINEVNTPQEEDQNIPLPSNNNLLYNYKEYQRPNYQSNQNNLYIKDNAEEKENSLFYESPNNPNYDKIPKRSYADELLISKGYSVNGISNKLLNTNPTENNSGISGLNGQKKKRSNIEIEPNYEGMRNYGGRSNTIDKYKEFNFESSLRSEPRIISAYGKVNGKNYGHNKKFVNYTSPHGHYFDSSLQNGG